MQRRMNQARIGVAAVIGFLILLGGLLFMYMSENRSLRKQVEVLSTSLEDVKEKRSSLESEHTDCLIQVCVYVCMCVCVCVCVCARARACACVRACVHLYMCVCV